MDDNDGANPLALIGPIVAGILVLVFVILISLGLLLILVL